jgi:hypothetical protein
MNKTTKILLGVGALLGVGTFVYIFTKKIKKAKKVGNIFTISALDKTTDTFNVYPQLTSKKIIAKRNKQLEAEPTSKSTPAMEKKYKFLSTKDYPKGSIIEITNGGSLNGLYKVKRVRYDGRDSSKERLGDLTLYNNKQWNGNIPSNWYVNSSKSRLRPLDASEVPTIKASIIN